jgi:hypothetical protein
MHSTNHSKICRWFQQKDTCACLSFDLLDKQQLTRITINIDVKPVVENHGAHKMKVLF